MFKRLNWLCGLYCILDSQKYTVVLILQNLGYGSRGLWLRVEQQPSKAPGLDSWLVSNLATGFNLGLSYSKLQPMNTLRCRTPSILKDEYNSNVFVVLLNALDLVER